MALEYFCTRPPVIEAFKWTGPTDLSALEDYALSVVQSIENRARLTITTDGNNLRYKLQDPEWPEWLNERGDVTVEPGQYIRLGSREEEIQVLTESNFSSQFFPASEAPGAVIPS